MDLIALAFGSAACFWLRGREIRTSIEMRQLRDDVDTPCRQRNKSKGGTPQYTGVSIVRQESLFWVGGGGPTWHGIAIAQRPPDGICIKKEGRIQERPEFTRGALCAFYIDQLRRTHGLPGIFFLTSSFGNGADPTAVSVWHVETAGYISQELSNDSVFGPPSSR
jgi:hypothetical protein